jgi:transcriptional regulator with XRE-family HTH domain
LKKEEGEGDQNKALKIYSYKIIDFRKKKMIKKTKPDPVDIHVGARVRLRRTLLGMSQAKLGKGLGLTFQQIQKYERGANRIGSSRLYYLSQILDVSIEFFFEGIDGGKHTAVTGQKETLGMSDLSKRETLELAKAYYQIKNLKVRKKIFEMIKVIAQVQIYGGE